ncbi:sensor histidine kinase [Haematomicrobium sanguinis]|uniref:sensor histidine kinase n=1 Tax=Haematomicrobium sanguinis TaxID=479106 RepID=UPI00047B2BBC|nr:HAMP domain-containing sensor histidine kinase [Haematomicrobium sanguinis]
MNEDGPRRPGLSARWKLTLSYAIFLVLSGVMLFTVGLFLLRYVPNEALVRNDGGWAPNQQDLLDVFVPAALWTLLFLGLLGLAGGWWLAGRMLRPLETIHQAALNVSRGDLAHRIELPGPQDEFRELGDVFNTMLDRIQAQIAQQRRFAANVSHELRTPLALNRALVDVARATPNLDVPSMLNQLERANDRSIDTVEALLTLSRVETGHDFESAPVDLSLAAEEALEVSLPMAEAHGVTVLSDTQPAASHGDQMLLNRAATNLVQNAIVHNAGPQKTLWIRTFEDHDEAVLTVENTGAPLNPATIEELLEPFHRGSRARGSNAEHQGVGLGLAITSSIAQALGGSLELRARTEGGLRATLRLKSKQPSQNGFD